MSSSDVIGMVGAVFLFLITALTGLIAWIFLDTRSELKKQMREMGKHMDSLVTSCWGLTWRADGIETFLQDELGYRPPRVPIPPSD